MIAAGDLKDAPGVGKGPLLYVFHPSAIHGERNVVLRFAGHRAGVTPDALAVVDDESVSHPELSGRASELTHGLGIVADEPRRPSDRLEAQTKVILRTCVPASILPESRRPRLQFRCISQIIRNRHLGTHPTHDC